jgi:hypothetical protein
MAEPVPPVPAPGRPEPDGRPTGETPATAHRATDRTMAAAAAAAAATAAVAALPPVTAPIPVPGRRARPSAGNPYAPGGPEAAVTGPLPAAASLFAPAPPHQGLGGRAPAHGDPAGGGPAARPATPAPWTRPVTPDRPDTPAAPGTTAPGTPATRDAAPSQDGAVPLDPPSRSPRDTTDPAPAEPGTPGRSPRRGTFAAAALAVVALATTVVVVADRWPSDGEGSGVSLSANPTVAASAAPPSATPSSRQSPAPPVAGPARPKLGVFRGTSRSEVRAFERWSGADVDYVMDYSARDTWPEIADPQYMLDEWRDSGYRPVYAVAMLPATASASLEAGARGEYDRYFRQLARNLVRADQADAILRVGWEFNVNVSRWKARDPAVFKAYWRHVVAAMRSVPGQRFEFDWNVNASNIQIDAARFWPGGDVVDYVGVDVYDLGWEAGTYPYPDPCGEVCRLAHQRAAWDEILGGERGLAFWSDFAKRHGKPMSVPEWGLWRRDDGHGGGDNPYFVAQMHAFLTDPANNVAYQGYFEANEPGLGDYHRLRTLSGAGSTFRRLFR